LFFHIQHVQPAAIGREIQEVGSWLAGAAPCERQAEPKPAKDVSLDNFDLMDPALLARVAIGLSHMDRGGNIGAAADDDRPAEARRSQVIAPQGCPGLSNPGGQRVAIR
jgi:hypothetical protein